MTDAKRVLEQAIELWNTGTASSGRHCTTRTSSGRRRAVRTSPGSQYLKVKYFDALLEAAPDRASIVDSLFAEGDLVAEEGRTGTHTGTWRNPDGVEIPATGKERGFSVQRDLPS